jgi:hypothetical protein
VQARRLTLFSDDKPDRLFTVIKFWIDQTLGASPHLERASPPTKLKTSKAEFILLLHLSLEEENEDRWCLWRPDQAGLIPGLF